VKKKEYQKVTKSSRLFKIVLGVTVVIGLLFVLFLGVLFKEEKTLHQDKSEVLVVMEENQIPSVEKNEAALNEDLPQDVVAESIPQEVFESIAEDQEILLQKEADDEATLMPSNEKYVAIVIDDMGVSPKHTEEMISLKAPITSSFLTYGNNLKEYCAEAVAAGHEIMMHTPMEPEGEADLAPDTLKIKMSDEEIEKAFLEMLSKFEGLDVNGINGHMGSLFTQSAPKLDVVMRVLKEKGMFFLDSKTSQNTKGPEVAAMEGVPFVLRDVFLDNENSYEYVMGQLKKTEDIALKNGYAVAIGHPKSETFKALKDWLGGLDEKGLKLVHLSEILKMKYEKN